MLLICKSGDLLKWKCLFIFGIGMNGFSMYVLQKIGCGSLKWLAAVFICKIQFLEKNF